MRPHITFYLLLLLAVIDLESEVREPREGVEVGSPTANLEFRPGAGSTAGKHHGAKESIGEKSPHTWQ